MSSSRNLTQGPVWRKLAGLALPMIMGIVAVLSVSLVDTYFVGKLGADELTALSFTFPVTLSLASLSIGLGAGAASVVSRAIGGGKDRQARRLATDSLFLGILVVTFIAVVGYFSIRPVFSLLGADGNVLDLLERYMRIWFFSLPFLIIPQISNAIIRAAGDAFWPSLIMTGSAFINMIATPVLVFGWGPIPALHIEGAAWGTLIARAVTLIFSLLIVVFREKLISLRPPPLEELAESWQRILKIGVPASVGNMVNPLGITVITALIAGLGDDTVAAFGVATRVESFASIPMLALSAAIGPMAGQNWGGHAPARVRAALRISYISSFVWAAFLMVFFWMFAGPIASLFAPEQAIADEATLYLKIVPFSLWGYGVVIVAAGCFNAMGKSVTGLGYYLVRTALFYVPLSWIAVMIAGSREVFIAIAVTNVLAGLSVGAYSLLWLRRHANASGDVPAAGRA